MDSDTYVNSSPIAKGCSPTTFQTHVLLRNEVRDILNPVRRGQRNIVLALPMSWHDLLNRIVQSNIPPPEKKRYRSLKRNVGKYVFPQLAPNKTLVNVDTSGISDPLSGLSLWLDFYELPERLNACCSNKLDYIHTSILRYLESAGATRFPFTMVLSYSPISMPKMKTVHRKLVTKVAQRKGTADKRPLFTLHLQDQDSPYVLFWLDTENICSFNLSALESPEALADFANTLVLFFNFSLSSSPYSAHISR